MRLRFTHPLLLASLAVCLVGSAYAADGPTLPWADPIGVSPTYGTARPSLPYAEPIGTSRLHPPRSHHLRPYQLRPHQLRPHQLRPHHPRPHVTIRPRPPRYSHLPRRSCYRFRDNRGFVGTRCVVR